MFSLQIRYRRVILWKGGITSTRDVVAHTCTHSAKTSTNTAKGYARLLRAVGVVLLWQLLIRVVVLDPPALLFERCGLLLLLCSFVSCHQAVRHLVQHEIEKLVCVLVVRVMLLERLGRRGGKRKQRRKYTGGIFGSNKCKSALSKIIVAGFVRRFKKQVSLSDDTILCMC